MTMPGLPYDLAALRYDGSPEAKDRALAVLNPLRPQHVAGFSKRRFGRDHDGGYVMVDDFAGITAAYSLGISDDVSWDLDIATCGIDVFQYDHTIAGPPQEHERFHWSKTGVSGEPGSDPDLARLNDIIAANGHLDARGLVLKCDIECYEWHMLALGAHETSCDRFDRS